MSNSFPLSRHFYSPAEKWLVLIPSSYEQPFNSLSPAHILGRANWRDPINAESRISLLSPGTREKIAFYERRKKHTQILANYFHASWRNIFGINSNTFLRQWESSYLSSGPCTVHVCSLALIWVIAFYDRKAGKWMAVRVLSSTWRSSRAGHRERIADYFWLCILNAFLRFCLPTWNGRILGPRERNIA